MNKIVFIPFGLILVLVLEACADEQAYFLNFPTRFISDDGLTLWLCYSANFSPDRNGVRLEFNPPGGRDGLCLHEIRLPGPKDEKHKPLA